MKKIYSLIISVILVQSGFAQTILFNENFDNIGGPTSGGAGTYSFPSGWSRFDIDANTPAATVSYVNNSWIRREDFANNSLDSCAFSTSLYNPAGQADDWMVTPAVTPGNNTYLHWKATAYDAVLRDGYEVRIFTTAPTSGNLLSSATVFSIAAENNAWTARSLSLSAYANQTVYIAFRNNSNDKYLLLVDDVLVVDSCSAFTVNIGGDDSFCDGSSTTLTADAGYSSYLWSDGSTGQSIIVSVNGTYTVTVTDANGCTSSASVAVTENSVTATNLTADGPLTFCEGNTVNIEADPGYSAYQWSDGSTMQSIDVTTGGTYTVTVTGSNGCTSSTSVVVTVNPNPIIDLISQTNVDCNSNITGSFEVSASGGTGPYSYSLDGDTPQSSGIFTDLMAGDYLVTVVDSGTFCSSDLLVSITEPNSLTVSFSSVDLLCYDRATGSIDINVSGGTMPYFYVWSNGSTNEDIDSLVAGIYTVTITDFNGCQYSNVYEILEPSQITIGAQQSNVSCYGGSDGAAFVDVDGGTPGYDYIWDDGQTDEFAFNLPPGLHTVTITDANGCDTSLTFLITQPPLLDATATVNNVLCYGQCNGSVTVNAFGGTPYTIGDPYDISWNTIPVQTGATATGLCAGTYTATIMDSTGCVKDFIVSVSQPDQLTLSISPSPVECNGGNDGEATVIVLGGTPVYFYFWSNGQMTQTATGLTAGTYTVTVTDYNNCSATASVIISQPAAINVSGVVTHVKCNGGTDGKIQLTVSGGAGAFSYLWNTNPATTTKNLLNVPAGTYTVIVIDSRGCSVTQSFTINQPDSLLCNPTVTNVSCNSNNNGSITVNPSGGTLPYTIFWSNGKTTATNSGLTAGNYTVTITDANNCVTSCVITVIKNPGLVITGSVQDVNCHGETNGSITADVSSGVPPYNYVWNNGATSQTISGLAAGTYTVTVTDNGGCSGTASFNVTEPAALSCICNSNVHNVSCFGGSDGSITALPIGGTPPYSYLWSNGAMTQTISGLSAGTYTVTITDAHGCQKTGVVQITQPSQLFANISCVNNATCFGNNNGSACVTGFGGIPPYSYSWNTIPVQTTFAATGLSAGTYTATVTDANNCTATASVTIGQPSTSLTCSVTKNDATCFGQSNGTATANPTGGTPPYSYLWNTSPSKTTKTVIGLHSGTYSVIVTDATGCSSNCSVTINQPPQLVVLYSKTDISCNGGTNGAIDITVTGGTPPYSYAWSTGATTEDVSGLSAGAYSVLITDFKGCVILANIVLTQPSVLNCATASTNVNCNGANTGTATVNATGGTTPYSYLWSNGGINASESGLGAGTYTVTVTDSHGCTTSCSVTVSQPPALSCNVTVIQNVSCGNSNGKLQVNASGGVSPYTYIWSTSPVQTTAIATGLAPGSYSVIVTDSKGCTTICSGNVGGGTTVSCNISGTNVSCNGGADGTASVSPTGGTPPYTYLWNTSTAATTSSVSGLTAGTYTVTVTDNAGCSSVCAIIITEPNAISISISQINVSCNGGSNGSATANPSGGTPSYSYLWSNGQTSQTATGLAAGTYTVTVTDNNNCTKSASATITQPSVITCSTTSTDVSCFGGNNGTATVTAAGGTAPLTISWNTIPPQTTATATGLSAGTYTVTITDHNNCTSTCTAVINQPSTSVSCSISVNNDVSCHGGNNGSATVSASGGTPGYTYGWSTTPQQTTATATGLSAGSYSVLVTDSKSCTTVCTVTIGQPSQLACSVNVVHTSCGLNNGQASVVPNGGTAPYTFLWSTGSTDQAISGLSPATYTVTVTDLNGCSSSCQNAVNSSSAVIFTTAKSPATCHGLCNGSANVNSVAGATPPYSYQWSNGSTIAASGNLCAGTYTVTVTSTDGCSATASLIITQPDTIILTFSNIVNVACNNGASGQAKVNPTGGTPSYTYLWSNGQTTQTATGLSGGTYTVTVTDSHGCTAVDSVVINQSGSLSYMQSQTNVSCFGGNNGTATVTPSGGTTPYSYLWSNGQTNQTATGLIAGNYTVQVSDAGGCSIEASFVITQPTAVNCGISPSNPSCNGSNNGHATVVPSGGTPGYAFLWSNGQTTQTATGLSAGTYTVTVTDSKGCTSSCSTTLTNPPVISCSVGTTSPACNGGNNGTATVTPTGGTPPYTYLWSNGQTNATATALSAGDYTVTVTDQEGCSSTCSGTVTNPSQISISFSDVVNSTCGLNNGGAEAHASGGTGPYDYIWSNGQPGAVLNNVGPGTYTVTVTDHNGCSGSASLTITGTTELQSTISGDDPNCFGGHDGTATMDVTGGSGVYTYQWNTSPIQTTQTATGLGAGTYVVMVDDGNGCTVVDSIHLTQPSMLSCNVTTSNAGCGQNNGSVSVTATGGTLSYSYLWSNGSTNASQTNLPPGTYTVTVTDNHGCTTTCSGIVGGGSAITSITITQHNVSCNGGSDGDACVTGIAGGTSPYSYLWNTGSTSACISNLSAVTYTVTVTDANGCSKTKSVIITQTAALGCSIAITKDPTCSACNGKAKVTASGGTTAYSYSWNTSPVQTTATATGLCAGIYIATVTDAKGCTTTCNVTLTTTLPPDCNISGNSSICSGGSTQLCAPPGLTSYLWSTGATTQCIAVSATGTYKVTVTNSAGCTSSCSIKVKIGTPPNCSVSGSGSICPGNSTQLCAPASMASYLWSTGATTQCITANTAGTYTVTVTNSGGCTSSCSKAVTLKNPPSCSITGNNSACSGSSTQLCAKAGMSAYLWSTGATTQCITASAGGTYTVTVTNTAGCTSSCSTTVTIGTPPTCSITGNGSICSGSSTQLCAPAGLSSYLWSTGATTQCITVSSAGTYTVTVTNSAGCTSSCSMALTVNSPPGCSITGNGSICSGSSTQLCAPAGLSSYLWSTGATAQCITISAAGTYTVTVTNSSGCSSSCSMAVTVNSPPTCSITGNGSICSGSSTQLCAPGGLSSYLWSTGATTQCITVSAAGTYTVTVTNSAGCTSSCSMAVTVNSPPGCSITGNGSICSGSSTQLCAPAGLSSYLWSTGATTQCITVSSAGTYTVTVTNSSGCTSSCTKAVTVNSPPTCSITGNGSICSGSSTQLCAPAGLSSYLWSTGASTQCITVSAAGTYTVTVTNSAGCTSSCSMAVTVNSPPGCSITGNGSICSGSSTQLCAPAGLSSYLWSTGATTQCITVSAAGTYTVTVTNSAGCTSSCSKSMTVSSLPGCSITGNGSICSGSSTQLCAPAGLSSYLWSTGATTQCITVSSAGTYTVTVTNSSGCSSSCTKAVTVTSSPNCSIAGSNSICSGTTIQLCATGGVSSYLWSTGATTQCIIVSGGTFTVTVTNSSGCTSSCSKTVTVDPQITNVTITKNNVSCSGGSNGNACVTSVTGGTTPYSYLWNTGGTNSCISNLTAGTYTVTVTSSGGCISTASVTITQPNMINIVTSHTNASSCNNNDGSAGASATGGTPPYSFLWSNGSTASSISNLHADTYTVTVTDNAGCSASASLIVTQPSYVCSTFVSGHNKSYYDPPGCAGCDTLNKYLIANFNTVFPVGLTVGCQTGFTIHFTSANAVINFLSSAPNTNTLTQNYVDPPASPLDNSFAAQLATLALNIEFDLQDPNFAPASTVNFRDLVVDSGPCIGYTVQQLFDEGNRLLGGCTGLYSFSKSTLRNAFSTINSAWNLGVKRNNFLICPPNTCHKMGEDTYNKADENFFNLIAYPNPTDGILSLSFVTHEKLKFGITLYDMKGSAVMSQTRESQEGSNLVVYNFNNLPKGLYMMQMDINNIRKSIRIIIQ